MSPPRHGSYPGADGPARIREPHGVVVRRPKGSPERRRRPPRPTDWPGVGTDLAHPRIGSPARPSRPLRPTDWGRGETELRPHRKGTPGGAFPTYGPTDWSHGGTEFLSRRWAIAPRESSARTPKETVAVFYVCAGPKIRSGVGRAPPRRLFGGPHGPSARVAGGFKGVGSAGKRPLRAGPHGPSARISGGVFKKRLATDRPIGNRVAAAKREWKPCSSG